MRVGVLGPLEVVVDGRVVEIGGARLRALLIRLAVDVGRFVTVDALSEALWDDAIPGDRVHAVQSLVSRLRRALPTAAALQSGPAGYRLDLPTEAVDAYRFERLAGEGHRALRVGDPATAVSRLREALALWRGRALADVPHAGYAAAAAARLEELRLAAVEDRIEAELASGRHWRAVAELEELTAAYPLRERLRGLLIKVLNAAGRQAEALASYEEFRARLADELGVDPSPELRETHVAVLRGDRAAPPTPRRGTPRGNLRADLTSFVSRAEEQARIGKQLDEGRLVTLVGPGGAGKTRLATTFAGGVAGGVPGGVWLVELAPLTDPGNLAQTLSAVLGLREGGMLDRPAKPRDATSRLVEALSATETLIVLDNCEHLIDDVARLVEDLLGRCPRLRILATSREPLGILGEALCLVPPLPVPEPEASAAEALACSSVRLFADRAVAVRPDFRVTEANVGAVVEICRRLDGLPLAIELAAARLRVLPIEAATARLDDRFRLLTGGSRTAVPRHQTLHAVVSWSWDLLDDEERRLAQWLAVFPGTITPASAAYMCAKSDDVLDILTALVDKSILQVVEGREPRYRMLETIREYGRQRLAEAGEIAQAQAAHTAYVLHLAERAASHLRQAGQLPWITQLAGERENLTAAFHFACDASDADTAVRLAAALSHFWTIHGNHAEAASWLRLALDVPGEAPSEARTIVAAAYLFNTVLSGGYFHADLATEEMRARVRDAARDATHPAWTLIEPILALVVDDTHDGVALIDQRLSRPDPWTRAMLYLVRSFLHGNAGDMDAMRKDLTAAAEDFRAAGDRWGLALSLTFRAHTQITLGEFDGAIAALAESIRLLRELDANDDVVLQRVLLAVARAQKGDAETARAELSELVASGLRISSARYLVLARISLGDLARQDGDLVEATSQYDAAWEDLRRLPFDAPLFRAVLWCGTGHLAVAKGELAAAREHLAEALALAIEPMDLPIVADVGVGVAWLRWRDGAAKKAAEVLGAAHALRGAPDAFDPDVVRLVHELRGELGERGYEIAYAHGRRMDRTDALGLVEGQTRR